MKEEESLEVPSTRGQISRALAKINRLVSRQNLENEEAIEAFMQDLLERDPDDIVIDNLSEAEKAEDLVFEAMDCIEEADAIVLLNQALKLDPECMVAMEEMALNVEELADEIAWLEKAVNIGRKRFGGEFHKENIGDYWAHSETHSYLRCLDDLAAAKSEDGDLDEAIKLLEELLECDSSDAFGCSALLCYFYFITSNIDKYAFVAETYFDPEDTFHVINSIVSGILFEAEEKELAPLAKGLNENNPHLIEILLSGEIPEFPDKFADPGSRDEALYVAFHIQPIVESYPAIGKFLTKYKGARM